MLLYEKGGNAMRLLFLPVVAVILLLADQSARAQSARAGCRWQPGPLQVDGITKKEWHVRAGHFCQLSLNWGSGWRFDVQSVEIVEPPAQGTLRTSEKTEGRGIITYMPRPGFVGHDRFATLLRYQGFLRGVFTRYEVEVTVTR
jgi:hypothetical protein